MKRIIIIILTTLYIIISIVVTTLLLHYNDYNVTVINNNSLISLKKDYDELKKGSLVIVANKEVKVGDKIFYYEANNNDIGISLKSVKKIDEINANEYMYTLDNDKVITKDFIIGALNDAKVYPFIGSVLLLLESKWGFLSIIILPVAICFILEIYTLIKEFKPKKKRKMGRKNENSKNK